MKETNIRNIKNFDTLNKIKVSDVKKQKIECPFLSVGEYKTTVYRNIEYKPFKMKI